MRLTQVVAIILFLEKLNAVTTRGGKSTRDPPHPNQAGTKTEPQEEEEDPLTHEDPEGETPQNFVDTSVLPFPTRKQKTTMDEQFARFIEMIQKINVNVLLLDVMHVPTYALYIKDIINNKRPLPTTEVVKLTEECNTTILNQPTEKKEDLGCPTIGTQHFGHALCDLGASIGVMPKVIFNKLNFTHLTPTPMHLL